MKKWIVNFIIICIFLFAQKVNGQVFTQTFLANQSSCSLKSRLDGLNLKVETDERENETLEILHQVIEASQTVRIPARVDVDEGSDF